MRAMAWGEQVLAAHGLAPCAGDYRAEDLRALAVARGWRVEVQEAGGPHGRNRFWAAVWQPVLRPNGRAVATVVRRTATTEAGALARAIAVALRRGAL